MTIFLMVLREFIRDELRGLSITMDAQAHSDTKLHIAELSNSKKDVISQLDDGIAIVSVGETLNDSKSCQEILQLIDRAKDLIIDLQGKYKYSPETCNTVTSLNGLRDRINMFYKKVTKYTFYLLDRRYSTTPENVTYFHGLRYLGDAIFHPSRDTAKIKSQKEECLMKRMQSLSECINPTHTLEEQRMRVKLYLGDTETDNAQVTHAGGSQLASHFPGASFASIGGVAELKVSPSWAAGAGQLGIEIEKALATTYAMTPKEFKSLPHPGLIPEKPRANFAAPSQTIFLMTLKSLIRDELNAMLMTSLSEATRAIINQLSDSILIFHIDGDDDASNKKATKRLIKSAASRVDGPGTKMSETRLELNRIKQCVQLFYERAGMLDPTFLDIKYDLTPANVFYFHGLHYLGTTIFRPGNDVGGIREEKENQVVIRLTILRDLIKPEHTLDEQKERVDSVLKDTDTNNKKIVNGDSSGWTSYLPVLAFFGRPATSPATWFRSEGQLYAEIKQTEIEIAAITEDKYKATPCLGLAPPVKKQVNADVAGPSQEKGKGKEEEKEETAEKALAM